MSNMAGGLLSGLGAGVSQSADMLHKSNMQKKRVEAEQGLLSQRQEHDVKMEESRVKSNLTADELRAEKQMALEKYRTENDKALEGQKQKNRIDLQKVKNEGAGVDNQRTQKEQLIVSEKTNKIGNQYFGDEKQEFVVGREIEGDLPTSDTMKAFSDQVGQEHKAVKTKKGFRVEPVEEESTSGSSTLGVLNLEGMSEDTETKEVTIDGKKHTFYRSGDNWMGKVDGKEYKLPNAE